MYNQVMSKRRKKKKAGTNKAGVAALVLTGFVVFGIVVVSVVDGGFGARVQGILQSAVESITSPGVDKNTEKLADLDKNGDKLIIYTLDTGNSDCTIVRAPDGHSVIIDAADEDDFAKISGALKALKIEKLDAAIATHPHADHIGSMAKVVKRFSPDVVYMPEAANEVVQYTRMLEEIERGGAEIEYVYAPMSFELGDMEFALLNPQKDEEYANLNDASVVARLDYAENSALFTGDAETQAIGYMLENNTGQMDVDVLKVAHHGSTKSTTYELLRAVTPVIAVITAGRDNDYGHPHKKTLERLQREGIETLRTDRNGNIAIFFDGRDISFATDT